ncbi:hypothetical protein BTVI_58088 [Pitangus sulphuratus]|nr:hypothetical protein BTVI_58088 [Pitangus sulphuratus]
MPEQADVRVYSERKDTPKLVGYRSLIIIITDVPGVCPPILAAGKTMRQAPSFPGPDYPHHINVGARHKQPAAQTPMGILGVPEEEEPGRNPVKNQSGMVGLNCLVRCNNYGEKKDFEKGLITSLKNKQFLFVLE